MEKYMTRLLYPKTSHMDFNIGSALHYASKGEGILFDVKFFTSDEFAQLQANLEVEDKGDSKSYDFGLVTNKIKEIKPELYYARNEQGEPIWVKS